MVNGLLKKMKERNMVRAFRQVVTVTATSAPCNVTSVRTTCTPQNPATDNNAPRPYTSHGNCGYKYIVMPCQ